MRHACILAQRAYRPGDLPPEGYLAWHEWAEVQRKAGIKQVECGKCGRWKTPQELSGDKITVSARNRLGAGVSLRLPICTQCKAEPPTTPAGPQAMEGEDG